MTDAQRDLRHDIPQWESQPDTSLRPRKGETPEKTLNRVLDAIQKMRDDAKEAENG